MLGLIAKVFLALLIVIGGITVALNQTGAATWGEVSIHTPDVGPCNSLAETFKSEPTLTEVRWSWVQHDYGWACYYEFPDDSKTAIPMNKVFSPVGER